MKVLKKPSKKYLGNKLLIGWNEWCSLPDLNLHAIKAKIDTGAKTSAIHAFDIESFYRKGKKYVSFKVHPLQKSTNVSVQCKAPIIDERHIMSSNGHIEHRFVISTYLHLGDQTWPIELTLSNRDPLKFRLLLGREALENRTIINPAHDLRQGKLKKEFVRALYRKR